METFLWQLFYGSNNSFVVYISQMMYVAILFGMVYYIISVEKPCFLSQIIILESIYVPFNMGRLNLDMFMLGCPIITF